MTGDAEVSKTDTTSAQSDHVREDDYERIRQMFPELAQIVDKELSAKVAEIWVEVWRASPWDNVEDVPKNPATVPLRHKLVRHSRCVTNQAIAMARAIREFHGFAINLDWIIAGCLLHDVSKLLEFAPDGPSAAGTSRFGQLIQHGVYGVHEIFKHDLPLELAHIVGSHTIHSRLPPKTIEAVIVHYADYVDSDVLLLESGGPLFLSMSR